MAFIRSHLAPGTWGQSWDTDCPLGKRADSGSLRAPPGVVPQHIVSVTLKDPGLCVLAD